MFDFSTLQGGYLIRLSYNLEIFYLLTEQLQLINVRSGKLLGHVRNYYREIQDIYTSDKRKIATKINNKLLKYNKLLHDPYVLELKRRNKLKTFDEIQNELKANNIYLSSLSINYKKKKKVNLLIDDMNKKTFNAQISESVANQKYQKNKQSYYSKIMVVLNQIEIDKKEDLYLYTYYLTETLFDSMFHC